MEQKDTLLLPLCTLYGAVTFTIWIQDSKSLLIVTVLLHEFLCYDSEWVNVFAVHIHRPVSGKLTIAEMQSRGT